MQNNSSEELEIIERVLGYCREGGTDQRPEVMHIPVSEYTRQERLDQEIGTLFRQFPIIVGHASQLASPGDFLTHDATGIPMLITRTREGDVRAFLNVCRHRGARVESRACGNATTFSCPYHGWTYDLQGRLRGLRLADRFGELDKLTHGLVPVPVFERFGLVWVTPSPAEAGFEADIDAWLAPMAEQLGSLDIASHSVFEAWSVNCGMNWHIALEGFQEQYHFCSAHKHTACSAYLDTQGVYLDKYPHVRHAVPLAGIDRLNGEPESAWSYRANFMTQNYLFPCNFLQVMTDHMYIHTITPDGTDRATFQCVMLIPEAPHTEKAEKYWRANYDVVRKVFDEDFSIGEGIQAGLGSGANEHFTIGRDENGIQLARKALDDALAGRLRA